LKCLAIIGASGHGNVVAETAALQGWEKIHFYDRKWPEMTKLGQWQVVGSDLDFFNRKSEYTGIFLAIGDNISRVKFSEKLDPVSSLIVIKHPVSTISPSVSILAGVVVMAGAIINANCVINEGVIVNTSCTIDHDCLIGAYSHISPGANIAGGVEVGEQSWVGIGAVVKQGIKIGKGAIVGAGAVVVSDVEANTTVLGIPAKVRK